MKLNIPKLTFATAAFSTAALGAALTSAASAQTVRTAPRLVLNGYPLHTNTRPVTERGRVLVPLRDIFEELGARVKYDYRDHTITARRHGNNVFMTLGSRRALINGNPVWLDVPATAYRGRTLVPLRFVSEALGATVDFNSLRNVVHITDEIVVEDGKRAYDRHKDEPADLR